jgi:hypothetical protein
METIMFHCGRCSIRVMGIMVSFTMSWYIFIVYTYLHWVKNAYQYVSKLFLKDLISMCNPRLCGIEIMSWFPFYLARVESMATMVYEENKRCKGEAYLFVYTLLSCMSTLERWLNLSKQARGRRWWTSLIAVNLTLYGLDTFGLIITNLVSY